MATFIALLRGINVGKHNRIAMPDLRAHLGELGYGDVKTVVASGNIVLESTASAKQLAADLRAAIKERFDVDTPVVVRSATQLGKVVKANPFPDAAEDPKRFQVMFLDDTCPAAVAKALEEADLGNEQIDVAGREIYTWHRDGIQDSPSGKLLAKQLRGQGTARNWNTVLKLLELTG
jgi:uncharacterized protein (DUF1697 family)